MLIILLKIDFLNLRFIQSKENYENLKVHEINYNLKGKSVLSSFKMTFRLTFLTSSRFGLIFFMLLI